MKLDIATILSFIGFLIGTSALINSIAVNKKMAHRRDILELQRQVRELNKQVDNLYRIIANKTIL
jgi:hypothetical protein